MMTHTKSLEAGKEAAIAALNDENGRGGARKLAEKLGLTESAISQWPGIPLKRVPDVEAATGVHRSVLRPDHYEPAPQTAGKRAKQRRRA